MHNLTEEEDRLRLVRSARAMKARVTKQKRCPFCGRVSSVHGITMHQYRCPKNPNSTHTKRRNEAPEPVEMLTLAIAGPQAYVTKAIEEIDERTAYLSEQLTGMNAMQAELHALGAQRRLLAETLTKLADTPPLQVAATTEKTIDFPVKTF